MRGESVWQSLERTLSEAEGREYSKPEAPKDESVRDTVRRSMEQLKSAWSGYPAKYAIRTMGRASKHVNSISTVSCVE
jgi:hypothetical protein